MSAMTRTKLLAAAALLTLAGCQTPTARRTAPGASPAEVAFVTNAFQVIQFDRQEGALAEAQAKDPEVKALAQQLVEEADEFAARLEPVAQAAGIAPPTELRSDLRVRLGHMRLQRGLDFDQTYVEDQIASHEEALRREDAMSHSGLSPAFVDLARNGEGLVRANLEKLRDLDARLKQRR